MRDRILPDTVKSRQVQTDASSLFHNKRQALVGMLVWAVFTLIQYNQDYHSLGNSAEFYWMFMVRLGFCLVTGLMAWLMFFSTNQQKIFNIIIIVWGILAALVSITFYEVVASRSEGRYLIDLVAVFSFYYFLPSKLLLRVLPPLLLTIYDIAPLLMWRGGASSDLSYAVIFCFSVTNITGLLLSIHSHRTENKEKKTRQAEAMIRAELERLASTDPLTGTFNRRRVLEVAGEAFSRFQRYNRPFSLMMMDLDGFKQINDTFGHQQGDVTLVEFTRMIVIQKRESDSLGRMGGDEFCLVLPETNLIEAARLADRILRHCSEMSFFKKCALTMPVSVSIGIAEALPQDLSLDSLLARADAGLYNAKNTGKNRWALAHELPQILNGYPLSFYKEGTKGVKKP